MLFGAIHSIIHHMNIRRNVSATVSNGGAMDKNVLSTALIGGGLALSAGWSVCSTIHTVVSAPVTSLGTVGLGTAATVAGVMMKNGQSLDNITDNVASAFNVSDDVVNTTATAA